MCDVCVLCSLFSVAPTKACAALPRHRAPSRVCGRTRELSNPQSVVCTPLAKLIWIRLVVRPPTVVAWRYRCSVACATEWFIAKLRVRMAQLANFSYYWLQYWYHMYRARLRSHVRCDDISRKRQLVKMCTV